MNTVLSLYSPFVVREIQERNLKGRVRINGRLTEVTIEGPFTEGT